MLILVEIMITILAYFMGNVSPATILANQAGFNIKKAGSGNAGATNVLRTMGPKPAIITLAVDVLKGLIATRLAFNLMINVINSPSITGGGLYVEHIYLVSAWSALAVFLGHVWPVLLDFKGGKGVATAFGVIIATNWRMAVLTLFVFVLVVSISKMVSLGSIMAALSFLVAYLKYGFKIARSISVAGASTDYYLRDAVPRFWLRILPYIVIVVILIFKHRSNISRILKGEENTINLDF